MDERRPAWPGSSRHGDSAQYLAIRYTERLAEAGAVGSVGSRGDSYDNALAESFNGLYKTELIHRRGPWRNVEPSGGPPSPTSTGSTTAASGEIAARSHRPGCEGQLLPSGCSKVALSPNH